MLAPASETDVDSNYAEALAAPEAPLEIGSDQLVPALALGNGGSTTKDVGATASSPTVSLSILDSASAFGRSLKSTASLWLPWVVMSWLGGVVIFSLWNAVGWLAVQRLRTSSTSLAASALQETAARLARKLGLQRAVSLAASNLIGSPLVIGVFRPLILFPASVLCQLPPNQLEALLAHELAHILRQDYLINLVQRAIETVFFYHPAIWWISAQTCQCREYCCDDIALALTSDRNVYVRALAAVAGAHPKVLAPGATGGRLLLRLQRLLKISTPHSSHPARWLTGAAGLGLCIAVILILTFRSHSALAQLNAEKIQSPQTPNDALQEQAIQAIENAGGRILRGGAQGSSVTRIILPNPRIRGTGGPGATDALLKQIKVFKALEALNVNSASITDAGLRDLKDITSLQKLSLHGVNITDAGLESLKELRNLQTLELENTQVTDGGLQHLKELIGLQVLILANTRVSPEGLKELKQFPALQSLVLSGAQVTDDGIKALKGAAKLTSLRLLEPAVMNGGMKHINELKGLRELFILGPNLTDEGLINIKELSGLQYLQIQNADLTDEGLKELAALKELQLLSLRETQITDHGLDELKRIPNLVKLDLSGAFVTDAGLKRLPELKNLQSLILIGADVTKAGVESLRKSMPQCEIIEAAPGLGMSKPRHAPVPKEKQAIAMRAIEKIGGKISGTISNGRLVVASVILQGPQVADAALADLATLKGLEILTLQQTSISNEGLKHLEGLNSLARLIIRDAKITDAGLTSFRQLHNLRQLNLVRTGVTSAGVRDLQLILPECSIQTLEPATGQMRQFPGLMGGNEVRGGARQPIRQLNAQGIDLAEVKDTAKQAQTAGSIRSHGGVVLRDTAPGNHPVTGIMFRRAAATDADLQNLTEFPALKSISILGPEVTDKGMVEIEKLKGLERLDVGNTQITDMGLARLAALKNLQSLHIRETKITDQGLKQLKQLQNLQQLDICKTQITDAGLKELEALSQLKELSIGGSQVTAAGLTELKRLKRLQTLTLVEPKLLNDSIETLKDVPALKKLTIRMTEVNEAWVHQLKKLTNLESLDLSYLHVTDAALTNLQDLANLSRLYLKKTDVTAAGLKELRKLHNLETLDLGSAKIADAGLKELKGLVKLKRLMLDDCQLTNAGLRELKELQNLEFLNLRDNAVSAAAVEDLQKALPRCQVLQPDDLPEGRAAPNRRAALGASPAPVPKEKETRALKAIERLGARIQRDAGPNGQIVDLDFRGTAVKDADLKDVRELTNLRRLYLGNTQITDEGLKQLHGLKNLEMLGLAGVKVSPAAVTALRAVLPKCQIIAPGLGQRR